MYHLKNQTNFFCFCGVFCLFVFFLHLFLTLMAVFILFHRLVEPDVAKLNKYTINKLDDMLGIHPLGTK